MADFKSPPWDQLGYKDSVKDLVQWMLTHSPSLRPNGQQILNHAWVRHALQGEGQQMPDQGGTLHCQ